MHFSTMDDTKWFIYILLWKTGVLTAKPCSEVAEAEKVKYKHMHYSAYSPKLSATESLQEHLSSSNMILQPCLKHNYLTGMNILTVFGLTTVS